MNKPYLNILIWLASVFLMLGNAAAEWKSYEGLYYSGFENSSFVECGGDDSWWLETIQDAAIEYQDFYEDVGKDGVDAQVDELSQIPNEATYVSDRLFVRLEGRLSGLGEYGHLGGWKRQLIVRKFFILRFAEEDIRRCE